ncbi:MAG: energy coupling factor transporter S component ThiW [Clostridiales bacterium]|nr:energy coupling factor transporter S component ThiW [Clostridiales bacterium]
MKRYNILRIAVMAMLIAVGVVISPILRIEGMCPMAHLINITAAVLLGPVDAFLVAVFIGIIRMCLMGIPPLALTGAVFGALLSGILYKVSKGKIWAAVLGEIVGTGIIGAIVSYPVMAFICGREGLGWFFYVPSFICGTLIGGSVAFVLLYRLQHIGVLKKMQTKIKEGGLLWKKHASTPA